MQMNIIYNKIPKEKREIFLKELLKFMIEDNGLGSVSKKDLEAYTLFLFLIHTKRESRPNSYELSEFFRTKENKIKELLEIISVKFLPREPHQNIECLLNIMLESIFEVESLEKGQIRFSLSDLMLFRHLQHYFRLVQGSVSFNRGSEQVIISQKRLYDVLEYWWDNESCHGKRKKEIRNKIRDLIGNIGSNITDSIAYKLRTDKSSIAKFKEAIEYGSKLSSIGNLFINLISKYEEFTH